MQRVAGIGSQMNLKGASDKWFCGWRDTKTFYSAICVLYSGMIRVVQMGCMRALFRGTGS
jgi:hypothetical protein